MKRTTIFVDEAIEYDLKAIARRRGQPVSSIVREALAEYVAAAKQSAGATLSFVAAGASGHTDTADRHEEILWQEDADPAGDAPRTGGTSRRAGTGRKTDGRRGRR